jgi:RNA recognition motif-containing protein
VWLLAGLVVGVILGMRVPRGLRTGSSRAPSGRRAERITTPGNVELYVGNLPYDLSEDELNALFTKHGKIVSARIITNKFNNKSKGYAFVTMAEAAGAQSAVDALNNKDIKGRQLVVNEAKAKSREH